MFKRIRSLLSKPTTPQILSKTMAAKKKELEEAELALLAACSSVEYAIAHKTYQETRIARLRELILVEEEHFASLSAVNEVLPAPVEPKAHHFRPQRTVHPFKTPEIMARKVPQ